MSNDTKNRTIIEHLINDKATELMPLELNKMLEQELSKPAEEVDAQLVRELMGLLEEEVPTQESKDECWKAIQTRVHGKSCGKYKSVLFRACAIAAAMVLIVVISFGTAKALNWTFLLKILGPAAETFGIHSTNNSHNPADPSSHQKYADADVEFKQMNYAALADMPAKLNGFTIVPKWIPERYAFASGSIYEDGDTAIVSMLFQNGEEFLALNISFYENESDAFSYVYESYPEHEKSMNVENHSVTYYHNDNGEIRAISAISQNAHVYVGGSITEHELAQIISSMI